MEQLTPQHVLHRLVSLLIDSRCWDEFTASEQNELMAAAHFHKLAGALYCKTHDSRLISAWSQQRLESAVLFELLAETERDLEKMNIKVARIKSASLVPRLHGDPGARHMCDADILVRPQDLERVEAHLQNKGFIYRPVIAWKGSRYRRAWEFQHPVGLPFSLDLHTQIMWNQEPELTSEWIQDEGGFNRLPADVELLHLIVNWIEQDTFIDFNKMYDIYLFIRSEETRDWAAWFQRPAVRRHWRSIYLTRRILNFLFGMDWPVGQDTNRLFKKLVDALVDEEFLVNPRSQPLKYFAVKHVTKPARAALEYDILWGLAHARPLARRLLFERG